MPLGPEPLFEWLVQHYRAGASVSTGVRFSDSSAAFEAVRACDLIESRLRAAEEEWHEEVTQFGRGGRQVLMCHGSTLIDDRGLTGHVVVFDDITTLVRAQRDAAWGEVARRLAHEIKNPLTPMKLSIQHLRSAFGRRAADGSDEERFA